MRSLRYVVHFHQQLALTHFQCVSYISSAVRYMCTLHLMPFALHAIVCVFSYCHLRWRRITRYCLFIYISLIMKSDHCGMMTNQPKRDPFINTTNSCIDNDSVTIRSGYNYIRNLSKLQKFLYSLRRNSL